MTMTTEDLSCFLAFRRTFPIEAVQRQYVYDEHDIRAYIERRLAALPVSTGILLGGGRDSAILAKYLPEGATAYTVDFLDAPWASEFHQAARFVKPGMKHHRIMITREEYFRAADQLITLRRMPINPHDPVIYLVCKVAGSAGITHLVHGDAADSRFGGFPTYYRNSQYEAFIHRILKKKFWDPSLVLTESSDVNWVFRKYKEGGRINVQRYLSEVGTSGGSLSKTIESSGINSVGPYGEMTYARQFDVDLIIGGQSKYLLTSLFHSIYPGVNMGRKFALHVPYDLWMLGYRPKNAAIKPGLRFRMFQGKRNFLVYSVERYLELRDAGWVLDGDSSAPFTFRNLARKPIFHALRAKGLTLRKAKQQKRRIDRLLGRA